MNAATPPTSATGRSGAFVVRDPPGAGAGPSARLRHPFSDLAAVPEGGGGGHGQAGLTREQIGTGRCVLQVLGSGPAPRSRQSPDDLAGLTLDRTGAEQGGLQALKHGLEVVAGVGLDGIRKVAVLRDAAKQDEQLPGRQWTVIVHARIVTDSADG